MKHLFENRIRWIGEDEGIFGSRIFGNAENENQISVFIDDPHRKAYAKKCVAALNSLSGDMLREICRGIIASARENPEAPDFVLPELSDELEVLQYCWFVELYLLPEAGDEASYVFGGEGDWGEVIGFVIEQGRLRYVGVDYMDYLNESAL